MGCMAWVDPSTCMGEQSSHDDVVVPRQHPGNVLSRFTLPNLDSVGIQVDGMASETREALVQQ